MYYMEIPYSNCQIASYGRRKLRCHGLYVFHCIHDEYIMYGYM